MDLHYNAFISYRHHPDDIRVAEDIHRSLERFRVPKAIRKKSKGITRLFRDKDELPITSSLTDDIYHALENSDYLIVICSIHTKESIWVQREIETFLKTHSRNKVLTVLASGEPYDVIPEILLYEDRYDEETGQTVRVEYEPLSCDWRMGRKQAMREELPRLAAALLGCGYDELRQRQRQYRMRRMITFFSLALTASVALSIYFLQTSIRIQKANEDLQEANDQISAANVQIQQANVQIQDNLDQALRNQSEYLASSSQERREAGDRLTAICLALAALPNEQNQRPYVPGAELSLSKALASYEAEDTIHAVGAFAADSMVNDFQVTEDGNMIYMLDVRGVLSAWDTTRFEKLGSVATGVTYANQMCVTPENHLLLLSNGDVLYCYDSDGTLLWQLDCVKSFAYLNQRTELMVLRRSAEIPEEICFVQPDTGEQTQPAFLLEEKSEDVYIYGFTQLDYESQYPVILDGSDDENNLVLPINVEKRTLSRTICFKEGSLLEGHIQRASVSENGNILIMVSDGSGAMNGNYGTFETTSPARSLLYCYHGTTQRLMWSSEIVTSIYSSCRTLQSVPGKGHILAQAGNRFQVYEETSGKMLATCETPSIPVTVIVNEEEIMGITENGKVFYYDPVKNSCQALPFFDGSVTYADVNRGCYILEPLGQNVTLYRSIKDDSGIRLDGDYNLIVKSKVTNGNDMAVMTNDYLHMFDLASKELRWKLKASYGNKVLGFYDQGQKILMWNTSEDRVEIIQVSDGTMETVEIHDQIDGNYSYMEADVYVQGDQLWYALETWDCWQMYGYNLKTGEETVYPIEQFAAESPVYAVETVFLHQADDEMLLWRANMGLMKLNLQTMNLETLTEEITEQPASVYEHSSGKILLLAGNEVWILSEKGAIESRIHLGERKAVSACCRNNVLFALCDDGKMYRYDLDGTQLSVITLNIFDTFYSNSKSGNGPSDVTWDFTSDGVLVLNAYSAGNIIDCQQWECRGYVPYMVDYSPENDMLLCHSDGNLFAFQRYTTQELMEKATKTLNGFTLTPEQKQAYGLS